MTRRHRNRRVQPEAVESLELRAMLTPIVEFSDGDLEITATSQTPNITVSTTSDGLVTVNGQSIGVRAADVDELEVRGTSDANRLNLSRVSRTSFRGLRDVEIYGLAGDDVINGSRIADDIYGGAGNDTIRSGDGNDDVARRKWGRRHQHRQRWRRS